jgi:hypothetical protein
MFDRYEPKSERLLPRGQFYGRLAKHLMLVAMLVGVSLLGGMAGYMYLAHMPVVDAFLNASMLLGGMGPVGDLPNDASKWFAGLYALYAGLVFIASAGILVAPVAHRILHRLHVDDRDIDSHDAPARRRPAKR